jgi:hypothetical protein
VISQQAQIRLRPVFLAGFKCALLLGLPLIAACSSSPTASDTSLIKNACKEWSRTPREPATPEEWTEWLNAAQVATKKALIPATEAAEINSEWDTFVGNLVILQANMDSLQQSRVLADEELWDYAVTYLKSSCNKMLN